METPQETAPAGQDAVTSPAGSAPVETSQGIPVATPTTEPSIKDVLDQLAQVSKSYKEVQGFSTKQAQSNAELKRQLAELQSSHSTVAETLRKAMQLPHDPDQFMEEWRKNPNVVLERLLKEKFETLQKGSEEQISSLSGRVDYLQVDNAIKTFRADTEGHPDFAKLEKEMGEITRTPGLAPNPSLPPDQYVEALYQAAKLRHAEDALKAAEEAGRKKAEETLARESRTTVAGGGKQVSLTTDPSKMTAAQVKEAIARSNPSLITDGYE